MDLLFRPLTLWPGTPTKVRKPAKFRTTYNKTLALLGRELDHLRARNIVLQVALRPDEIRLDGLPRSGARPSQPGVILAFDSRLGPLQYPCDTFDAWEDNLRAIALSLEALRSVDRYGVTRRAEQYRGWQQLSGPMTANEAALLLSRTAGNGTGVDTLLRSREALRLTYHAAALRSHPDRGGSAAAFQKVQEAKEVLEKHLAGQA